MPGKSQSDIAYGFAAVTRLDPRYYAYWMMNNVLGQFGLGGRLADNIRERQGMAYYAFSTFEGSVGEGPLLVQAGVDPQNVRRTIEAIDTEIQKLQMEGPTLAEVEETRESLIGSIPRMFETNESIAEFLQIVGAVRPRPALRPGAPAAARARSPSTGPRRRARVARHRSRRRRGGRPDAHRDRR